MRRQYIAIFVVASIATFVIAMFVFRHVSSVDSPWVPKCVLHQMTGLHCPGCGTTRALHALANGRLFEAIRFNPLMVLGLPVFLVVILRQRRREQRGGRAWPGLAWACAGILVAYTLARNIPSPQRAWLAPPTPSEFSEPDLSMATQD